ncbi:CRISPR-associated protein, Crm2 family [Candidatus Moduliflexus flocculans]|uniref:CRISPR-associated protein, Crm2 family n=1 Tax=Candidatus Moduliflexus flocculans TaxID=1499966 RepID=A0A081BLE5_9BACT|nr:CRISPR-associated protein, Crm2 family [Candidatus Moduliflexus flocculans]
MTKFDVYRRLLSAFLHDPIDKSYILMQKMNGRRINHEQHAKDIADTLQASVEPIQGADWIAAGMERLLLPQGAGKNEALQVTFLETPEIRHPLSGQTLSCDELKGFRLETVMEIVTQTAHELKDDDQKRLYLNLWRNYVETLQTHSPEPLKKYWSVIPADTRIPDHSISDHLRTASACAHIWSDGKELRHDLAFLLFSIGPVQSFIETARKTQDLWMGSFLLSYLIWEGMKIVVQSYGPDAIIFPDLHQQPLVDYWLFEKHGIGKKPDDRSLTLPTMPNRFLAILPADVAQTLAKQVEEHVKNEFMSIGKQAIQKAIEQFGLKPKHKPHTTDMPRITEQLASLLNVFWVVVPWKPLEFTRNADSCIHLDALAPYLETNRIKEKEQLLTFFAKGKEYPLNIGAIYGELHSLTEQALAARKHCRDFTQHEEPGRKCSLCGERQALFQQRNNPSHERYKDILQGQILRENEQLCAICMTKRMGRQVFQEKFRWKDDVDFPSTSEIATADFKQHLLRNEASRQAFEKYVNACRMLFGSSIPKVNLLPAIKHNVTNIDGDFFIEDYLTEKNLKMALHLDDHELSEPQQKNLEALQNQLTTLQKKYASDRAPSSYYAVIMLDGDKMGKWLKGDFAPKIGDIFHSKIWKNLPEEYKRNLEAHSPSRPISPAIHRAISCALREYTLTFVREIVEKRYLGKLVYAGGDDVLAFVNLHDLIPVMLELRAAFSGHINKEYQVDFTTTPSGFVDMGDSILTTMGPHASASMGVTIAYYKTPLSLVLQRARQMEKKAKHDGGRDAFGISLMKHSGDAGEVVAKWYYSDFPAAHGTIAIVEELIELFREGKLSPKFLYTLRAEFDRFADENGIVNANSELMRYELRRILLHSGKEANSGKQEQKQIEELSERLFTLFEYLGQRLTPFVSLFGITKFLAQEVKDYAKN